MSRRRWLSGFWISHTRLATLVEIRQLSFSICLSRMGQFTDGPCLGHRPSLWTSLWWIALLQPGWFSRGRQNVYPMAFLTFLFLLCLAAFCWRSRPLLKWSLCLYPPHIDSWRRAIRCWLLVAFDCLILLLLGLGQTSSLVWQCYLEKWWGRGGLARFQVLVCLLITLSVTLAMPLNLSET